MRSSAPLRGGAAKSCVSIRVSLPSPACLTPSTPSYPSWGLLGLGAGLAGGCRCHTLNQTFGKMLEEALVRMEWLPFSPEVLLGWALPSCTAATPRPCLWPCLWPCLCSRLATHPRWTQVKGCKKHTQLVHKACLALETKHHMLEQPEQKDEPKAKGPRAEGRGRCTGKAPEHLASCSPTPPYGHWRVTQRCLLSSSCSSEGLPPPFRFLISCF